MLGSASGSLINHPDHPPTAPGGLVSLVPDPILGAVKHVDFGELQQSGRRGTIRFFGTGSKVPIDLAASARKTGKNGTSEPPPHATGPACGDGWPSAKSLLSGRFFYIVIQASLLY